MASSISSALAAHRFGLGEPDLSVCGRDPVGWLRAQIGPADVQSAGPEQTLPGLSVALPVLLAARRQPADAGAAEALRRQAQADIRARVLTAASTARPFAERLAMFWSNHFSLSTAKGAVQGLVGAFEREAIRPHIAGRFADLLYAATTHPAMLRYLDNTASAGPQSAVARRAGAAEGGRPPRGVGLNENLARELLELHTLGAADGTQGGGDGAAVYGPWGGYTQADIVALAAVLSGWRGPMPAQPAAVFDARWHQPGPKRLLGRSYPEGPDALRQVLDDLARHPSTARHLATKLVRHVVADAPPPSLVDRLARRFTDTDGDLAAVADALLTAPEAWQPAPLRKLKSPEEFVVSSARLLRLGERTVQAAPDAGLSALGQRPQAAPSPAGWPERADGWLGPEAVWRRVEWAHRLAQRAGRAVDARALAESSLGPLLGEHSREQIARAADGPQALALLLLAPEFQRR